MLSSAPKRSPVAGTVAAWRDAQIFGACRGPCCRSQHGAMELVAETCAHASRELGCRAAFEIRRDRLTLQVLGRAGAQPRGASHTVTDSAPITADATWLNSLQAVAGNRRGRAKLFARGAATKRARVCGASCPPPAPPPAPRASPAAARAMPHSRLSSAAGDGPRSSGGGKTPRGVLRGVRNKVVGVIKKEGKGEGGGGDGGDFGSPRAAAAAAAAGKQGLEKGGVASEDAPRKSGVLIKYTNAFKGWKPRRFTLEMGLLTYVGGISDDVEEEDRHVGSVSKKLRKIKTGGSDLLAAAEKHAPVRRAASGDKERDIKGVIDVQYAVVTADDSDSRRFAIDTGHEVFHVRAANREERDSWVAALAASRRYFSGLVERAASRSTRGRAEAPPVFEDPARKGAVEGASPTRVRAEYAGGADSGWDAFAAPAAGGAAAGVGDGGGGDGNGGGDGDGSDGDVFVEAQESTAVEEGGADGGRGDFGEAGVAGAGFGLSGAEVGLAGEGLGTRAGAGYARSAASTADSFMGDDGLAEAAASRRALEVELRRVITTLLPGEPESLGMLFDDVDAPGGIRDLCTWTLHVLQTDTALVERRVEAGVRRYLGQRDSAAWAVDGENDGDIDETEFYDAVGRDSSTSFGREASEGGRLPAIGSGNGQADGEAGVLGRAPVVAHGGPEENVEMRQLDRAEEEDGTRNLTRVETRQIAAASSLAPRTSLPPLKSPPPKLNIWQLLKDAVGKDLSKISLPVGLNEPLGFLQRLAEDIEYSELLDEAAAEPDQHRRLLLVATMVISHYSSTQARIGKPFNPLQGETYSLVMPNKGKGVRFLAEQVSNHPPKSVCYAEGSDASWKYYNSIEVKNKFWGKSLEVFPTGWNYVEIPGFGDVYEFEQVTASVHNIFLGTSKMWLDNYGDMAIVNRTTGDRCEIKFQKSGLFSDQSSLGAVSGIVYDCNGRSKLKLSGRWADAVYEDLPRRQRKLLWKVRERPPLAASNNYNMTQWAIALNQPVCEEDLPATVCTDSRVRPDLRALENGDFDLAGRIKVCLEGGQRARRAAREARGEVYAPRWFDLVEDPATGREEYRFNGQYFRAKASRKWEGVEDLFGCAKDIASSSSQQ